MKYDGLTEHVKNFQIIESYTNQANHVECVRVPNRNKQTDKKKSVNKRSLGRRCTVVHFYYYYYYSIIQY